MIEMSVSVDSALDKLHPDIQLETDTIDDYTIHCGQIFVTRNKLFTFSCSLCDEGNYSNFEYLLNHTTEKHFPDFEDVIKEVATEDEVEGFEDCDKIKLESDETNVEASEEYEVIETKIEVGELHFASYTAQHQDANYFKNTSILNSPINEIGCSDNISGVIVEDSDVDNMFDVVGEPKRSYNAEDQEENYTMNISTTNSPICEIDSDVDSISDVIVEEPKCSYIEHDQEENNSKSISTPNISTSEINSDMGDTTDIIDEPKPKLLRINIFPRKCGMVFVCELCKLRFNQKHKLRLHMISHNAERRFKCEQCGLTFKRQYSLNAHERRHTGIRDHACSYCPKKFYTNTELKQHIRIHTGERPYVCSECGKTYNSSGFLSEHMKRHQNLRSHKCDYCDKSFFNLRQKRSHQTTHTGERKHACSECNATFALRKTMMRHMKIHLNIREHRCDFCNAEFIQKQNLKTHMKTKHNMVAISNKLE